MANGSTPVNHQINANYLTSASLASNTGLLNNSIAYLPAPGATTPTSSASSTFTLSPSSLSYTSSSSLSPIPQSNGDLTQLDKQKLDENANLDMNDLNSYIQSTITSSSKNNLSNNSTLGASSATAAFNLSNSSNLNKNTLNFSSNNNNSTSENYENKNNIANANLTATLQTTSGALGSNETALISKTLNSNNNNHLQQSMLQPFILFQQKLHPDNYAPLQAAESIAQQQQQIHQQQQPHYQQHNQQQQQLQQFQPKLQFQYNQPQYQQQPALRVNYDYIAKLPRDIKRNQIHFKPY